MTTYTPNTGTSYFLEFHTTVESFANEIEYFHNTGYDLINIESEGE